MSKVVCSHAGKPGCDPECPHRKKHIVRYPSSSADMWNGELPCIDPEYCAEVERSVRCKEDK